jgi:hypothetical protein
VYFICYLLEPADELLDRHTGSLDLIREQTSLEPIDGSPYHASAPQRRRP